MNRYGVTVDDVYEQELRDRARQWEVRVDGEAIRRFADTPEGRVRADKLSMHLIEQPWVDRVEVVPIESAAPAQAAPSREPRGQGRAAGSFGPTYNVVPFNRVHRSQTRRAGLDEAMETHPSAGGVVADKCGIDCPECSDRRV